MLQALATQVALDDMGIENETIDVSGFKIEIDKEKKRYFIKAAFSSDILRDKKGKLLDRVHKKVIKDKYAKNSVIRKNKFEEFLKREFRLSEKNNSLKELSNQCFKYDAIIVGSDQLWLPGNIVADYFTLNFVPIGINTIAYSTSFGQASIPSDIEERAYKFLKKIKHISVREETGQELINKIVGRKVPVVCDPTMLIDAKRWTELWRDEKKFEKKYIFCYFLGTNKKHRDFAKRLKKETGYKLVSIPHVDEYVKVDELYADEKLYDIGPSEFVKLIHEAEYVCTDSFHATVFSILFHKKFYSFRRYKGNTRQSTNSRLDTLFSMTGIENRLLSGYEDINSVINLDIDYVEVDKKVAILKEKSKEYLFKAVNDLEDTDLVN